MDIPEKKLSGIKQLYLDKKFIEAEELCKGWIKIYPQSAGLHALLGASLEAQMKDKDAADVFKLCISLLPDSSSSYYNLGVVQYKLKQYEDSLVSYSSAIELNDKYVEAYDNYGVVLNKMGRHEEAIFKIKVAIKLNPKHLNAYANLATAMFGLGRYKDVLDIYTKEPNLHKTAVDWAKMLPSAKVLKTFNPNEYEAYCQKNWFVDERDVVNSVDLKLFYLYLKRDLTGNKREDLLKSVINTMHLKNSTEIINPKPTKKNSNNSPITNIIGLKGIGRSGTGLMHGLIDGHSAVSTMPSIYFSEYFDPIVWKTLTAAGWNKLVDNFIATYYILFDSESQAPVPGKYSEKITGRGVADGMTALGVDGNESLYVDEDIFRAELKKLISYCDTLNQLTFFQLVHRAYDKAIKDINTKNSIFYHIHNPTLGSELNFIHYTPSARWLVMVREPIQGLESWVKNVEKDYENIVTYIVETIFEIDQPTYGYQDSIGVRLEDLKLKPEATLQAICGWIGIDEEESLYEMTQQGKRWWGCPASPDYKVDGMLPFGTTSIKRKLGSIFSENDQLILRTLFYPFSVRFGYVEENLEQFRLDIKLIRPMLDKMFDFELNLAEDKNITVDKFICSGSYLFLRASLIERWNILDQYGSYENMLKPLIIEK